MSGSEHLVQMANDIGNFFRAQANHEAAVAGIANHIKSFWTPRMLKKLLAQIEHGETELDDLPREALGRLNAHPGVEAKQPPGGDAG
jgi:formate dehydrogenase subunit delta